MTERMRRQQPPARSALQITALDQERLDDVLDRIARLGERRRHGLDAHRPAAVVHRDRRQIAAAPPRPPPPLHFKRAPGGVGGLSGASGGGGGGGENPPP